MTQTFEAKPIRRIDQNGALYGVGVEWTEEASWRYSHRPALIGLVPIMMGAALFSVFLAAAGTPLGLIAVIAASVWVWRFFFGTLPRRSVIFMRNGRIALPHGLPGHKKARWLKLTQPDIESIEIGSSRSGMQHDWTSTVQFVSVDGLTDTIGQKLHREEAREVAVKLNLALREIRGVVAQPLASTAPVRMDRLRERVFD
jgi:hypothetical protein